jgi:hypothetical protein
LFATAWGILGLRDPARGVSTPQHSRGSSLFELVGQRVLVIFPPLCLFGFIPETWRRAFRVYGHS